MQCELHGSWIDFVFGKTGVCVSFCQSRNGEFEPYCKRGRQRLTLSTLFGSNITRRLLLHHPVQQQQTIVFNLDKKKTTPPVPELMGINRYFRELAVHEYYFTTYLVKLRSRTFTSMSASFPKLKTWAEQAWMSSFPWSARYPSEHTEERRMAIVLEYA